MEALMLLHGFSGHPDAWLPVRAGLTANVVSTPTLAGHAGARVFACDFVSEVDRLAGLAHAGPVHLVGYSLGARLALGIALRHPECVSRLTLISVNPGLESERARSERVEADEAWASMLELRGLAAFAHAWQAQPIFAHERHLSQARRDEQHALRMRHDAKALAGCMRALSLARMPNYWPALAKLTLPVQLIAGSADAKFRAIAERMLDCCSAQLQVVENAGHNVLLEQPTCIARTLNQHTEEPAHD
jgi:2-succinyl-6-hydroxy-2,4-cyclohexadiene-1-carboxylate synthase